VLHARLVATLNSKLQSFDYDDAVAGEAESAKAKVVSQKPIAETFLREGSSLSEIVRWKIWRKQCPRC
jgi:hypothetical protein